MTEYLEHVKELSLTYVYFNLLLIRTQKCSVWNTNHAIVPEKYTLMIQIIIIYFVRLSPINFNMFLENECKYFCGNQDYLYSCFPSRKLNPCSLLTCFLKSTSVPIGHFHYGKWWTQVDSLYQMTLPWVEPNRFS